MTAGLIDLYVFIMDNNWSAFLYNTSGIVTSRAGFETNKTFDTKSLKNRTLFYTSILYLISSCPEDFKVNPGAVESLCEHPKVPSRLLIGYNRGLVVLWDRAAAAPTHTFVSNQQLESLCWNDDGWCF